jgi:hypothetical protein
MATSPSPVARIHQASIVSALASVFGLPAPVFNALQRGGARTLEKLVRSYHYWVEEHSLCPYDLKHRRTYFRMTPAAASSTDRLHPEHVVPVARLRQELINLRPGAVSVANVVQVMSNNEIVLVTHAEHVALDKAYARVMPAGWTLGASSHLERLEKVLGLYGHHLVGTRQIA